MFWRENPGGPRQLRKLDGVGPVDNRPSTDKLHHFVKKKGFPFLRPNANTHCLENWESFVYGDNLCTGAIATDILKVDFLAPSKFYFWQFCARKGATKTLNMLTKWVKIDNKLIKEKIKMYFPVCMYKSKNFVQSQLNFALSRHGQTVTFRNSA